MQQYSQEPVELEQLIAVELKSLPLYQRSKRLNVTNASLGGLQEIIETSPDGRASAAKIANKMPDFIEFNANAQRVDEMPYGWEQKRLIYVAVFKTPRPSGVYRSYIQGYTDYFDPPMLGANNHAADYIDPNTTFYINSIVGTMTTVHPQTGTTNTNVTQAFQLMYDVDGKPMMAYDMEYMNNVKYTTRPEDITIELVSQSIAQNDGVEVVNTVSKLSSSATPSSLLNNIPTKGIAEVVNSYLDNASMAYGSNDSYTLGLNASSTVNETNPSLVPFIAELVNYTHLLSPTSFRWSDLLELHPEVRYRSPDGSGDIFDLTMTAPSQATVVAGEGHMDAGAVSLESTIATQVAEAIIAVALNNRLTNLAFTIHNMTYDGSPEYIPITANTVFKAVDPMMEIEKAILMFVHTVFPTIHKGYLKMSLTIDFDLYRGTNVSVALEGGNAVPIYIPTYAMNMGASIITDRQGFANTVNGYNTAVNHLVPMQ